MKTDPCFLTISEASALISSKSLSPLELTSAYIDRIERLDDELHAFRLAVPESAITAARDAESEIARSGPCGPLHGIPFGVKDLYDVRGLATTAQSALYADHVAVDNAFVIARLLQAGAIFLGKHTTWEFAVGGPSFESSWPPARNPWDVSRDPGGSSSGSGAAVAAGLSMFALGSDTGGSTRFPAAWCGVAGFKPTYGLVSKRGVFPLSYTLDHVGAIARTSDDCRLIIQAIAGYDREDPTSVKCPDVDFRKTSAGNFRQLRIGLVENYFGGCVDTDAETTAAIEQAVEVFRSMGISVRRIKIPPLRSFGEVGVLISRSEAFAIHEAGLKSHSHLYGSTARTRLILGAFVRAPDYINALRYRTVLAEEMNQVMTQVDLLIMPAVPGPAPVLEEEDSESARQRLLFTRPFNVTGAPVISVCTGYNQARLPLAMQIAGRPFEDHIVLQVASAFEQITEYYKVYPPGFAH